MKIIILITLLFAKIATFHSESGFIDTNFILINYLEEIRDYLPVSLMLNSVEQYLINSKELTYEIEACYLNLNGDVHFDDPENFTLHQRLCLNNFLNYYSLFKIINSVVIKFFAETCPEELLQDCHGFLEHFGEIKVQIMAVVENFVTFLIESDKKMKTLDKNFADLKADNIQRVVMNSILILNKENFYSQLNDVLEEKNEEIALDELGGGQGASKPKRKVEPVGGYQFKQGLRDDPFQNPDRYFLCEDDKEKLEDLHIVFRSEENASNLVE